MPATKNVITIDPAGQTLTVDILDSYSVSVTAYTASGGSSTHSLPLSISTRTAFYLVDDGRYTVSAKYRGVEIAGDVVDARGGVPIEVRPTINSSVEQEATFAAAGGDQTFGGHLTMTDAKNIIVGSTNGSKIGTATTQKLGFYNATPIVQPSALTQTYATADPTLVNLTAAALTDSSGGASGGTTIAAIGAAVDPTAALKADTANAVATLAAMANKHTADHADLAQFVNSVVDKLQALGLLA